MKILSKEKLSLVRRIVLFHILVNLFNIGLMLLYSVSWDMLFCLKYMKIQKGFPQRLRVKESFVMQEPQETWVWSLGREDPLEEEGMATYSSVLASRIPPTEEPGGLQSTQSPRVRHNWSNQHTITLILFYVYFSLYIKSIFKINFIMGALQCCVGFCGTEKWISYMFTYIPPFPFWITFPFRPP